VRAFPVFAAAALVCTCLLASTAHSLQAQVLSGDSGTLQRPEPGGLLAGTTRTLRPALATRLGPPAVMDADDEASALPLQIPFALGSARLTVSATRALDHLGQSLSAGPLAAERLRIEGHADAGGSPEANHDISERRAMAVAAYLEQNFAISPARLACIGQGAAPPSQRIVLIARLTSG